MKRDRKAEAKIKNFTPLMDELVQEFGITTAAVWGRVWRYAQQENRVCQASHDKIADELGVSRRTVIRHIKDLVDSGYLKDHTPDLRNRPHTYSITRKARIEITITGVTESHSKSKVGVTESPSDGDRKSHEETIKETKLTPYNLAVVLADVCKMDLNANKGRLLREAKLLNEATPTPTAELVSSKYGGGGWWYANDWRGQKGEPPAPHFVRETWGRWSNNGSDELVTDGKGMYL